MFIRVHACIAASVFMHLCASRVCMWVCMCALGCPCACKRQGVHVLLRVRTGVHVCLCMLGCAWARGHRSVCLCPLGAHAYAHRCADTRACWDAHVHSQVYWGVQVCLGVCAYTCKCVLWALNAHARVRTGAHNVSTFVRVHWGAGLRTKW